MLVLSLERCDGGEDADGVLTLDLHAACDGFLVRERAKARRELDLKRAYLERRRAYDAHMVEYRERAEAHAEAVRSYEQEERSWRMALRQHWDYESAIREYEETLRRVPRRLGDSVEHPGPPPGEPAAAPEKPGTPPQEPVAPGPQPPDPAPLPSDEELTQRFAPTPVDAWTARLTTTATTELLERVLPDGVAPPPPFVTATLNSVAAVGWTVHHVAEDRTLTGEDLRLVAVRYLLRRVV